MKSDKVVGLQTRVLLNTLCTVRLCHYPGTDPGEGCGGGGGGLQLLTPHYEKLKMKEMKSNCLISQYTFSKLSGGGGGGETLRNENPLLS